jgi:hypothetical protein
MDVAYAEFAMQQKVEYSQPVLISQSLKALFQFSHE